MTISAKTEKKLMAVGNAILAVTVGMADVASLIAALLLHVSEAKDSLAMITRRLRR